MEEHRLIDKRLEELRTMIINMGSEARVAVDRAMRSIVDRDSDLAAEVLGHDAVINDLELQMDREVIEIFALLQPTARDLRFVIAVAKITPILERIADHAGNIASAAIELNNEPQLDKYVDLPRMAERASEMLAKAIDAFNQGDAGLARHIIAMDQEIDSIYHKIVRELMHNMRSEPATSIRFMQLLFVAKHLERIGDYVTDICELTVYMIEAEFIKHKFEKST
ncbi:MAG: phosphate signaling complex protein PhoU [Pyrinomonadaceae bacterium]|nr:phosphate signaling complex protein PhoU [Pyrinomonadaceae bacterium]MBP6213923.1 phosphate signaling complex protein PhoU [Pyrinomonadaceae bacterium]